MPRGFTLIELLVVIAIIGILAGIVLAALGNTRQQALNAGAQGNFISLRTQAEVFAGNNNNSYSGFCTDTKVLSILTGARNASSATGVNTAIGTAGSATVVTCHATANAWAAEAPLVSTPDSMWCVDSTGKAATTSTSGATSASGDMLAANEVAC